jgi:hypothetical protein
MNDPCPYSQRSHTLKYAYKHTPLCLTLLGSLQLQFKSKNPLLVRYII